MKYKDLKTFLNNKITKLFTIALLFPFIGGTGGGLYAQDAELFRTWYLTKVTVNNIDYIPSDYGYYPDLILTDDNGDYGIYIADPDNISCQTSIENFQGNPDSFIVNQDGWACFPETTCSEEPLCYEIYGIHSEVFYGFSTPFFYNIEQNNNVTFSLEITNSDGNKAFYSSEFLSLEDFKSIKLSIFPNPVKDLLHITYNTKQVLTASIYDIQGRVLMDKKIEAPNSTLNVSALQTGLYFVVFENETGKRVSKKFIKQ